MATESVLKTINVFPSAESYETNSSSLTDNEISLVPVKKVPTITVLYEGVATQTGAKLALSQSIQNFDAIGVRVKSQYGFQVKYLILPVWEINQRVKDTPICGGAYYLEFGGDSDCCTFTYTPSTVNTLFVLDSFQSTISQVDQVVGLKY